jgi:hypothetical protein
MTVVSPGMEKIQNLDLYAFLPCRQRLSVYAFVAGE